MTRKIAIAVPKGGVGKTTTTLNLGAALVELGRKVLMVDFDPQGSLTLACGTTASELKRTVYDEINEWANDQGVEGRNVADIRNIVLKVEEGLYLVPANLRLNVSDNDLRNADDGSYALSELLEVVTGDYDYILIDTLPYLGILATNALVAADEVIIPVDCGVLAMESSSLMLDRVAQLVKSKRRFGKDLKVTGILLNKAQNTRISKQVAEHMRATFADRAHIFNTTVKLLACFQESQAAGQSVIKYDTKSACAEAFRELAREVEARG